MSTSQPTNTPETIVWLPDGCPDWCNDGDLHGDDDGYDDRSHTGGLVILPLLADGERPEHTDKPELHVHVQQHYREIEPRIHIGKNGAPGVFLTLAEAERLATVLLKTAALARNGVDQEDERDDDVKAAFYAGHCGGVQGGDVTEHWQSYAKWKAEVSL